ncbi:uncharacterized protein METZ01_LOCUS419860 [marine metagenome]|uniref:Uncharacterized protein n=1 Tax=marine metagenome TaxID=408172 RepID=A0A382X746_9ZZZZ
MNLVMSIIDNLQNQINIFLKFTFKTKAERRSDF